MAYMMEIALALAEMKGVMTDPHSAGSVGELLAQILLKPNPKKYLQDQYSDRDLVSHVSDCLDFYEPLCGRAKSLLNKFNKLHEVQIEG
eukprot:6314238-Amphidinium_carterae.2